MNGARLIASVLVVVIAETSLQWACGPVKWQNATANGARVPSFGSLVNGMKMRMGRETAAGYVDEFLPKNQMPTDLRAANLTRSTASHPTSRVRGYWYKAGILAPDPIHRRVALWPAQRGNQDVHFATATGSAPNSRVLEKASLRARAEAAQPQELFHSDHQTVSVFAPACSRAS